MSAPNKLSKLNKFSSILLGGVLLSLMCCVNNTVGFGNYWETVSVGFVFTLLIFSFYGNRAKMKFELISIGAVFFSLSSLSGVFANVNFFNNVIFSALLGFSLLGLYGIFIGSIFSLKEYKIYHYLILAVLFFAAVLVSKATFSHILLRIISPETASDFKAGLEENGINLYWREAYLNNFNDINFAGSVSGGLEYYNYINIISYAFASLVLIVLIALFFRDKITALLSLLINVISAAIVTALNFIFSYCLNYNNSSIKILSLCFALGFGLMLIIALIPNKYSAGRKYRSEPYIQNRFLRLIVNFILFEITCVIAPVRILIYNLAQNAKEYNILFFLTNYKILIIAGISLIIGLIIFNIFKKNIYDKNLPVPFKIKPIDFSRKAICIFTFYYSMTYLLTGNAPLVRFVYRVIKNPSVFPKILTDDSFILLPIVALFSILFFVIYFPAKKRLFSHH